MPRLPDLARSRDVLTRLVTEYPEARRYADRLLATRPWPADTMAGGVTGGDISDPTGNNAVQDWLVTIDELDRAMVLLVQIIDGADGLCREIRGLVLPHNEHEHRCNRGAGMKGAMGWKGIEGWAIPDCERYTSRDDGLCERCRQRMDDWMRWKVGASRDAAGEWQLPRAPMARARS